MKTEAVNYVEILHNNVAITTLQGFLSAANITEYTPQEILDFEDNRVSIFLGYTDEDIRQTTGTPSVNILRSPTLLKIPTEKLRRNFVGSTGNLVLRDTSYATYIDSIMRDVIEDPGYIRTLSFEREYLEDGAFRKIRSGVTVYLWSRALENGGGAILDITPFITSINTSVTNSGGNFSLELMPIGGKYETPPASGAGTALGNGKWIIDEDLTNVYVSGDVNYVSKAPTHRGPQTINQKWKQGKFFFHEIIQENDLLFIKFEQLQMESSATKRPVRSNESVYSSLKRSSFNVASQVWDMIALVDQNRLVVTQDGRAGIGVNGRDMMKLVLEDGAYYTPLDMIAKSASASGNRTQQDPFISSVGRMLNGRVDFVNLAYIRDIEFTMRVLFNIFSTVRVVDNNLFAAYPPEKLSTRSEFYVREQNINQENLPEPGEPIDQAGINFQKKVQSLRQREERALAILDQPSPGIWSIIRLLIDQEVRNRRVSDLSLSQDTGSLYNFIQKVCQNPFVEFWGDTYGQNYVFVARKMPFDRDGYTTNHVIDIDGIDVYTYDFAYSNQIYSWYELQPKSLYVGAQENVLKVVIPPMYFPEYVEVWGSRPLSVVSNYLPDQFYQSEDGQATYDSTLEQALNDLKYVIESHAYLPFSREGTIVMRLDRRIKRGMMIRFTLTGELFHVDAVSHSHRVSRGGVQETTTISVSRGLVERYTKEPTFNYFNLISFDDTEGAIAINSNFRVNKPVFDFFLGRNQFQDE
jgi:hypothetical protein